jgi:hypothetical protein
MGRGLHYTTEQFIEKCKLIFGNDRLDFSPTIYDGSKKNIIVKCNIHGIFNTTPNYLLESEHGCQECGGNKKLTTETFIKRAYKKHNCKYDYSLVKYLLSHLKVDIICPIHGKFSQIANDHLQGHGCDECGGTKAYTLESFIEAAVAIFGLKFDYSLIKKYKNSKQKIDIICPVHGKFTTTTAKHLFGYDCKRCAYDEFKVTIDEFIERSNLIHDFEYCYDLVKLENLYANVEIICFKHGSFFQSPHGHLAGNGCKYCSNYISRGEAAWLNYLNVPEQYRQLTISANGRKYTFDGFDKDKNTIYEFNGDYWHGNPEIFDRNKINRNNKETFGALYDKTIQRENELRALGYNLVVIWENDWKKIEKELKKDGDEKVSL